MDHLEVHTSVLTSSHLFRHGNGRTHTKYPLRDMPEEPSAEVRVREESTDLWKTNLTT